MAPAVHFFQPYVEKLPTVQPEKPTRSSSHSSLGDQNHPVPGEVFAPHIPPRVEKGNKLTALRILNFLAVPFPQGARNTSQSQIIESRQPARRPGDNMIDMKGRSLPDLG